jgi:hypothetical protein
MCDCDRVDFNGVILTIIIITIILIMIIRPFMLNKRRLAYNYNYNSAVLSFDVFDGILYMSSIHAVYMWMLPP